MTEVTMDTILNYFEEQVREKQPIPPHAWLDGAQKMNVLIEDQYNDLYALQQFLNTQKSLYVEQGNSVAAAKIKVEASNEYRDMKKKESKIERILEFIRLAKLQSRLANDNIKGY